MATAVSIWSPVIMIGRMPASRHSRWRPLTSGRHGVDHAEEADEARDRAPAFRPRSPPELPSQGRIAAPRTRSARSAITPWHGGGRSALYSSVIGTDLAARTSSRCSARAAFPARPWCTARSGRSRLWTVDIILRPESNGASPMRGNFSSSSSLSEPEIVRVVDERGLRRLALGGVHAATSLRVAAQRHGRGEQDAVVRPNVSTTVILFCVSVPVLSEQMICAQPSVSTAVRRRMIALRRDMFVTPMESTTVTTAARPSGMAATASETAIIKESSMTFKARNRPRAGAAPRK